MKKNIIHFSMNDYTGAGLAALRFHKNLKKNKFNSYLVVNEKKNNFKDIIELNKKRIFKNFLNKVEFFLLSKNNKFAFYDKGRYLINDIRELKFMDTLNPEVVIFHWVTNFINPILLNQIKKKYKCKIIWNVIDIAPLTGGCHINWGCKNFHKKCNKCPAVKKIFQYRPRKTHLIKNKIFNNLKLDLLYTGDWMGEQIKNSSIAKGKKSYKLMIPVDENSFRPNSKIKKKNPWNIKINKKIILFRSSSHLRKGNKILISSINYLIKQSNISKKKFCLMSIGDNYAQNLLNKSNIEYFNLGNIISEKKLIKVYQLADLFISPSTEDVGPMMINEAVMSGLPVISFDIGVAKDLIINKINGYKINKISYINLANSIKKFLNLSRQDEEKMKKNSRLIGVKYLSLKKHITTFNQILK